MRWHLLGSLLLLGLGGPARAGDLYVNGVRAEGLRDFEFENVSVRVDPKGNVWITAEGYSVEVEDDQGGLKQVPIGAEAAVPPASWWLVTEDNGSKGLTFDIVINGQLAKKVRSGDDQVILDIGPFLKRGPNTVIINVVQGRNASGGILYAYLGRGSNASGTVMMGDPDIVFARKASEDEARSSRTYQLEVP